VSLRRRPPRTHLYVEDTSIPPDWKGRRPCVAPCRRFKDNPVHDVPDTSEADAEQRRRIGDT
jgi:hypothetical protein